MQIENNLNINRKHYFNNFNAAFIHKPMELHWKKRK